MEKWWIISVGFLWCFLFFSYLCSQKSKATTMKQNNGNISEEK